MGAELPGQAGGSCTYPRDHELPAQVLHLGLHLAADVELVAVERDALQVRQQVLLARGVRALGTRTQRVRTWAQRVRTWGTDGQDMGTDGHPAGQGLSHRTTARPTEPEPEPQSQTGHLP